MSEKYTVGAGIGVNATVERGGGLDLSPTFSNVYKFECYDKDGNLKWTDEVHNLVVDAGLNDILDKYYKGSSYSAAFFVGLTDGAPDVDPTDTMSSHTGWVEVEDYSELVRQDLDLGSVSAKSVDNSAAKAVFSIDDTATVGGAFVTTNSTKGGTTGTLVGGGAFTQGDKSVSDGDTLNVTVTLTASSS